MNRSNIAVFTLIALSLYAANACADSVIINNNVGSNPNNSNGNNGCQNSDSSSDNSSTPPGIYSTQTHRGSSTTYSTGTNKPYLPNNNCNSQIGTPQPQIIIPFKNKN